MQYNLIIINYWPSGTTPLIATYLHDFIFAFIGIFHSAVSLHSCPACNICKLWKSYKWTPRPRNCSTIDRNWSRHILHARCDIAKPFPTLFTLSIGNHHIRPHNTWIEWCKVCGWTLQKRVMEHKYAVRSNNDIAVHAHRHDHQIGWDNASIVSLQPYHWKRRVQEAITIQSHANPMNLDRGLHLSPLWQSALDLA